MFVTTKQMLLDAQAGHYAVGAFNVENLEFVMAVVKAAEERRSPVILQTTPAPSSTQALITLLPWFVVLLKRQLFLLLFT